MKWYKIIFSVFVASYLSVISAETGKTAPVEKFVVGTASGYAPYVSLNEKGEYEGFDIDFAHLVAERLNKKLVIQDLGSMTSLLVALQKKKIDAIIWAMSITEERRKEMNMVYYQGEIVADMPFLFWKEAPEGIETIEDLASKTDKTICVEAGSAQDIALRKYPSLKIRFLDKITDGIMDLKYGKSFATSIDSSLVRLLQSRYPELKVLKLPLPENLHTFGCGVCLHKEANEMTAKLEKITADLRAEGKIAELEKKWNLEGI